MKFYLTALFVFGLDEYIKRRVEKSPETGERKIIFGRIILRRHHNRGVCLNFMDRKQRMVAALSAFLTAAVAIRLFRVRKEPGQQSYAAGLALLLGGALSNTWDRLHRSYVVDYFSINSRNRRLRDIIFNLSDFSIFLGALVSVITKRD